jgi:murein DD-endopeptidase MepM/ murein hydrolase activator NlpD
MCIFALGACDLQPKIVSLPDTVGDFISQRYPALLADPNTHPEIYNSAVSDYGVYASPDLYGSPENQDYVLYASVDDYIIPPQMTDATIGSDIMYGQLDSEKTGDVLNVPVYAGGTDKNAQTIVVQSGDTLYSLSKKHNMSVKQLAEINNMSEPYMLAVGQVLQLSAGKSEVVSESVADISVPEKRPQVISNTQTRVDLQEIVVAPGDTLYSLSRKYSVPVNDLAVMNKLSAPFALSVGQKLRVPDLKDAPVIKTNVSVVTEQAVKKIDSKVAVSEKVAKDNAEVGQVKKSETKISSNPAQKLPTINARSSSKFSWPVRGKILSAYGTKSNGLFNDGINIGASRGTDVKAAENGVVAYAGNEVKGMGNLVIIQHSGGWMTVYAHMDSMNVRRGAKVVVGQKIGSVGETGKVDSPQLHFEIRKGTKAYNPATYLKK